MLPEPRQRLIRILQNACSGELAAAYAYRGHWRSLPPGPDAARIHEIENDEWHHREIVRGMLRDLGSRPAPRRELFFLTLGKALGALCRFSGWFVPMYAAGRLERNNIEEYVEAAHDAVACGRNELVDCLLQMAGVEWDHEAYFRSKVVGHGLSRLVPLWPSPPPRESLGKGLVTPDPIVASESLLNAAGSPGRIAV